MTKEYKLISMSDDEIINTLSLCKEKHGRNCVACSLYKESGCVENIAAYALDLIARLKNDAKKDNRIIELQDKKLAEQEEEIERLNALYDDAQNNCFRGLSIMHKLRNKLKTAKSEAIKEFAERLKNKMFSGDYLLCEPCYMADIIDNLVKEMTESQ